LFVRGLASGGNEITRNGKGKKMGFDCLPLTRLGETVFIRECSRDKYSMCNVISREKERGTNMKATETVFKGK